MSEEAQQLIPEWKTNQPNNNKNSPKNKRKKKKKNNSNYNTYSDETHHFQQQQQQQQEKGESDKSQENLTCGEVPGKEEEVQQTPSCRTYNMHPIPSGPTTRTLNEHSAEVNGEIDMNPFSKTDATAPLIKDGVTPSVAHTPTYQSNLDSYYHKSKKGSQISLINQQNYYTNLVDEPEELNQGNETRLYLLTKQRTSCFSQFFQFLRGACLPAVLSMGMITACTILWISLISFLIHQNKIGKPNYAAKFVFDHITLEIPVLLIACVLCGVAITISIINFGLSSMTSLVGCQKGYEFTVLAQIVLAILSSFSGFCMLIMLAFSSYLYQKWSNGEIIGYCYIYRNITPNPHTTICNDISRSHQLALIGLVLFLLCNIVTTATLMFSIFIGWYSKNQGKNLHQEATDFVSVTDGPTNKHHYTEFDTSSPIQSINNHQ